MSQKLDMVYAAEDNTHKTLAIEYDLGYDGDIIVIGNSQWESIEQSLDYETDIQALKEVLNLDEDQIEQDVTTYEFEQIMSNLCHEGKRAPGFLLFILMTHGDENVVAFKTDKGNKVKYIYTADIIKRIEGTEKYVGIPKIFVIQACRGHATGFYPAAKPAELEIPKKANYPHGSDVFIIHAAVSGYVSWVGKGSLLIQELCSELKRLRRLIGPLEEIKKTISQLIDQYHSCLNEETQPTLIQELGSKVEKVRKLAAPKTLSNVKRSIKKQRLHYLTDKTLSHNDLVLEPLEELLSMETLADMDNKLTGLIETYKGLDENGPLSTYCAEFKKLKELITSGIFSEMKDNVSKQIERYGSACISDVAHNLRRRIGWDFMLKKNGKPYCKQMPEIQSTLLSRFSCIQLLKLQDKVRHEHKPQKSEMVKVRHLSWIEETGIRTATISSNVVPKADWELLLQQVSEYLQDIDKEYKLEINKKILDIVQEYRDKSKQPNKY